RAAELEGPESLWRPVVCVGLGAGLYFSGEFEHADPWLEEAAELGPSCGQWLITSAALAYRSLVLGELGQAEEQARLADEVMELTRELDSEELDGETFVAAGAALAAGGRPEEALPQLGRGVAFLRLRNHPRPLADALLRQVEVLRAMGRRDAATK